MSDGVLNAETEARQLGWVPLEEFRGDPEKWRDAETFLDHGKSVMPILRKNNQRLSEEVHTLREETARLQKLFQASQEAIQELQESNVENTRAAVERARKDLLASLKMAKESGDVDAEIRIAEELADLKGAQRAAGGKKPEAPPPPSPPAQPEIHPDFAGWMKDNPWFGTDPRKTARAQAIAYELRADSENDSLEGRAFYDRVSEIMEERSTGQQVPKVGGARHVPRGGANGGGRTYADLPPEAKEACDRQARRLVGEGRAFKDIDSWRKSYAATYFQEA